MEALDLMPNDVVKRRTLEIVENHLHTKKFTSDIKIGSIKGDNYIGIIYKAEFQAISEENGNKDQQDEKPKKLSMVIKVPPENKIRREKFMARSCFVREIMAYDELLPMFMRFQESKGIIPTENGFYEIADCIGTITDDCDEAIFMKNLMDEGFEMYDRHQFVGCDQINLVMKTLAKLHAISYAMKDQCPEKLTKYMKIDDIFKERVNDTEIAVFMDMVKDRALGILCPETQQNIIDRINKMLENTTILNMILELTAGQEAEPYAVFCHGDCWNNNILYKYKNGRAVEARLIDWQIMRYASPVCDLMYFLFLASSREQRAKHYSEFLDTYYSNLASFITRLGSSPVDIIPRQAFDDQLKKFGKFGFFMATMLVPVLTTHSEDVPDLDEVSAIMAEGKIEENMFNTEKSKDAYNERMGGVMLDMFELGYI